MSTEPVVVVKVSVNDHESVFLLQESTFLLYSTLSEDGE